MSDKVKFPLEEAREVARQITVDLGPHCERIVVAGRVCKMKSTKEAKMKSHTQQGDVLLFPVRNIPAGAKEIERKPVMEGEGHHSHVLDPVKESDVQMYEREGVLYFRLSAPTPLKHIQKGGGKGEHGTQVIEPGVYRVGQVHEWNPWEQEARKVVD